VKIVPKKQRGNPWLNEWDDLVRGACGGFLFGVPLLYTMEVWWIGSTIDPPMMIVAIVTTYFAVFFLNRTAGFRKEQTIRTRDVAMDSIEALAIGIVCTTMMLILVQEITPQVPLDEALGKILFESVPFTLGVALSNQFLRGDRNSESDSPQQNTAPKQRQNQKKSKMKATLSDIGVTLIGAAIVAFNIAPTDEVRMLASAIQGVWLLGMIIASLILSYAIVFQSGFSNQTKRRKQQGIFQRPLSETMMAYLLALVVAAFMLWFFQQISFKDPWTVWLEQVLILGLPAAIGGAAGRLAI
jgi:putative integral membrane protein (TIGR02587 family)